MRKAPSNIHVAKRIVLQVDAANLVVDEVVSRECFGLDRLNSKLATRLCVAARSHILFPGMSLFLFTPKLFRTMRLAILRKSM